MNDNKRFELFKRTKATKKEIFDIKSKKGMNIAGKTSKLEII